MAAALSIMAVTIRNNYKAQKVMRIRALGDYAVNYIHRTLSMANEITSTSPNPLIFKYADSTTYTVTCDKVNEKLFSTAATTTMLIDGLSSAPQIDIDNCNFSCDPTNNRLCNISITLKSKDGDTSETFSSQVSLRNVKYKN